jgi:hypothetical protein
MSSKSIHPNPCDSSILCNYVPCSTAMIVQGNCTVPVLRYCLIRQGGVFGGMFCTLYRIFELPLTLLRGVRIEFSFGVKTCVIERFVPKTFRLSRLLFLISRQSILCLLTRYVCMNKRLFVCYNFNLFVGLLLRSADWKLSPPFLSPKLVPLACESRQQTHPFPKESPKRPQGNQTALFRAKVICLPLAS